MSLPLAYVTAGEPETSSDEHEGAENWQPLQPHTNGRDNTVQDYFYSFGPQYLMPTPIKTFDGMTGAACGCAPPDTDGEVGKTQYVQMTNSGFQVFDKTTGNSVLGPKSTASIWSGFGGVCENNGKGDPIVLYDQLADRWVISQFAGNYPSTAITDQCIAVSTTSDATGSYYRYGFHLGSEFFDYPHMGMWPDGYYLSDNVFAWNGSPGNYLRPQPFAFDRVKMLSGAATVNFVTNSTVLGANDPPILPADLDGSAAPPNGAQEVFVEYPDSNTYRVYRMHPDYVTPANTTFTLVPNPPATAAFSDTLCNNAGNQGRACVPTPAGSSAYLDSLMGRLMWRLAYRNFGDHESLIGNFTVGSNNVTGIRWFELRNVTSGTPTVFQESTFQPDATWRWMGGVAMDQQGNMALGYSASSASTNPQIRYAGRLVSDPINTLAQTEVHMFDGPGAQSSSLQNRWGDYSDMTVDPVDDCTFWYTQEYSPSGGNSWQTRIGNFKFPNCNSQPDFTIAETPATQAVCAPGTTTYTVTIGQIGSFTNPVTLAASGLPTGVTASFNPATVTPTAAGATSTLTLTVSNTAAAGNSSISIDGTATGSAGHSATANLAVTTGAPTAATLSGPANGATGVATAPTFTWTAGSNTTSYTLEVATDSGFSNIVKSVPNLTATTTGVTGLAVNTTYYWHVKSINGCSTTTSAVSSFTTAAVVAPICSSPAKTIPASDSITITDSSQLSALQVQIQSTYSWTGDLKFTLSNGSSSDVLINQPGVAQGLNAGFGCGTGNINVTLDDTGTTQVDNQCNSSAPAQSGTDKPSSPIGAAFANKPFAGTWTLSVTQPGSFALGSGSLTKWCLVPTLAAAPTYKVGGNVTNLSGTGLVLSLNSGAQTLPVSASGAFQFPTGLNSGASYAVTVGTQPSGQTCTVSNGSGTIASANVTNVGVSCTNNVVNYTVTPSVSGGNGTISPSTAQTVASGATTNFTLTPNAGYHAVTPTGTCPAGSLSGNTYTSGAITANCTVIASFAINTYTVTATAGSNGTITPPSQTVNSGSTASFTVTPNSGYHVASVTGDTCTVTQGSGNSWSSNAITQNCAVTASFAINTYTVTASAGSNGTITPPSQTVNSGSTASFTVTPNAGYHVASVSGDTCTVTQGSGNSWASNAITQNCAVTASFAINTYTVTASAGSNGTITPPSQTVNSGGTASFTVNPNARYHVASVSGDTCTVTHGNGNTWTTNAITANCAVTASFTLNKLVFTTQPANVMQGSALGTIAVTEQDDNGNTMSDNATLDFALTTTCGTIDLGTATMSNGVATLSSPQRFYTTGGSLTIASADSGNTLATTTSGGFAVMQNTDIIQASGFEGCRP